MPQTRVNSQFRLALPFMAKAGLSSRAAEIHTKVGAYTGEDMLSCTALAEVEAYLTHRKAQAAEQNPRVFAMTSLEEYIVQISVFLMRQDVATRFDPNRGDLHSMIEDLAEAGSAEKGIHIFIICERWHPTRFKQVEIVTVSESDGGKKGQLTVIYADGRRTFD